MRAARNVPCTQTTSIARSFAGATRRTFTIWFAGGGGEWMQAPKYGTSRNSLMPAGWVSSGTTYPGRRA